MHWEEAGTYCEVARDVGSGQDAGGCWEKDGKNRKEAVAIAEIRAKVLCEYVPWKDI